ncbi:hypothetical protein FRC11_009874 [Ceratobasidium sp. 423]|nr:hypothetical protein FRC11_009874 [Ceratobasidium sp. 423]
MASETADIYRSDNPGSGASRTAVDVVVGTLGEVMGRSEAESVYTARAKGRPMILDNPPKESKSRLELKSRASRRQEDKRRRRQNIEHGKERLTPKAMVKGLKYSTFVDIHKLWCGYMSELLNLPALASTNEPLERHLSSHAIGMQTKLVKADFHGFLPKQNSIFTFTVPLKPDENEASPQLQFELYGNQFRYRAEDRASRKFKSKETIEL